jgi:membrane protein implicated in regulation of membrane protease activity
MSLFDGSALSWIALAVVAAIIEVSIPHFGLVFVSFGAVAAAGAAALALSISAQIVVFIIFVTVSSLTLRSRFMAGAGSRGVPSRTEQLVGKDGVVTQDIDATAGAGRINVGGEDWAARSGEQLPAGTRVRVVGADGIVLEVRRS